MSNQRPIKTMTPGGPTPGDSTAGEDGQTNPAGTPDAGAAATSPDMAVLQARVAALLENQQKLEAENAKLKKQPVKTNAPGGAAATSHAHLRAHEIDPDEIAAPVLSADGWVIPTPKANDKQRQ